MLPTKQAGNQRYRIPWWPSASSTSPAISPASARPSTFRNLRWINGTGRSRSISPVCFWAAARRARHQTDNWLLVSKQVLYRAVEQTRCANRCRAWHAEDAMYVSFAKVKVSGGRGRSQRWAERRCYARLGREISSRRPGRATRGVGPARLAIGN